MTFSWAWRDENRRIMIAQLEDHGLGEEICSVHLRGDDLPEMVCLLEERAQEICNALNQSVTLAKVAQEHQDKLAAQEDDTVDFSDVINDISDTLAEADGEYIAETYNRICSGEIEYAGDSFWRRK